MASPWPGRVQRPAPTRSDEGSNNCSRACIVLSVAPICDRSVSAPRRPSAIRSSSLESKSIRTSRKFRRPDYPHSILTLKQTDDVAEILRVIANHDRHAVLRRFDDIVSAARNQASAHECHVGQRIERREFANGVDQKNAAGDGIAAPRGTPPETNAELLQQSCTTSLKRSGRRGARIITARGWLASTFSKARNSSLFFAFHRAAADQNWPGAGLLKARAQTGDNRRRVGALTSNFRLPLTCTRSAGAPISRNGRRPRWFVPETGQCFEELSSE